MEVESLGGAVHIKNEGGGEGACKQTSTLPLPHVDAVSHSPSAHTPAVPWLVMQAEPSVTALSARMQLPESKRQRS